MTKEKVLKFAKKFGFVSVMKSEYNWRDYDEIWLPSLCKEGEPCYYGPLILILVKGNTMRMSTEEEGQQFLRDIPVKGDEEEDDEEEYEEDDSKEE